MCAAKSPRTRAYFHNLRLCAALSAVLCRFFAYPPPAYTLFTGRQAAEGIPQSEKLYCQKLFKITQKGERLSAARHINFNRRLQIKGLRPLYGLHTPRAHITRNSLAVCVYIADFLNVSLERSPRPSLGVAYVVSGRLSLTAYAAYSRHNKNTSVVEILKKAK